MKYETLLEQLSIYLQNKPVKLDEKNKAKIENIFKDNDLVALEEECTKNTIIMDNNNGNFNVLYTSLNKRVIRINNRFLLVNYDDALVYYDKRNTESMNIESFFSVVMNNPDIIIETKDRNDFSHTGWKLLDQHYNQLKIDDGREHLSLVTQDGTKTVLDKQTVKALIPILLTFAYEVNVVGMLFKMLVRAKHLFKVAYGVLVSIVNNLLNMVGKNTDKFGNNKYIPFVYNHYAIKNYVGLKEAVADFMGEDEYTGKIVAPDVKYPCRVLLDATTKYDTTVYVYVVGERDV